MSTRLNDIVPYDTIIRVLLRKIELQEREIVLLRTELERPHLLFQDMPEEEEEKLKQNPYYRAARSNVMKMEKRMAKMREDEKVLINKLAIATKIIEDFFTK